ncbi:MAG: ABC transporter permease [Chloroflexi bacterium]|nr:ABC transporter permease [Chloroflexota bacterium]
MAVYIARRLALAILTLWLVTIIIFVLLRVAPGDAVVAAIAQAPGEGALTVEQVDERREALGLNRPYIVQYADWIGDLATFDSGTSLATGGSVWDDVAPRISVTLELAVFAGLITALLGPTLGMAAAMNAGRPIDHGIRALTVGLMSLPQFWVGLVVVIALASWFGYFRAVEYADLWDDPQRNIEQTLLPALILALRPAALIARVVRASALDIVSSDYVRASRARGLAPGTVAWRHVFRNAMLPGLTVLGAQMVFLLGGAVVIESVFNLPGLGRGLVLGVSLRDYPLVQFMVIGFAATAILINLGVDLAYARLDPRIILTPVAGAARP